MFIVVLRSILPVTAAFIGLFTDIGEISSIKVKIESFTNFGTRLFYNFMHKVWVFCSGISAGVFIFKLRVVLKIICVSQFLELADM